MNAQEAIGFDDPASDWILQPEEYEKSLPPEAGPLKRILRSETVRQLIRDYREADRAAIKARARYVTIGRWLIILSAAAIMFGAAYLLVGVIDVGQEKTSLRQIDRLQMYILWPQIIAFLLVVVLAIWMREDEPFEDWMRFRARAETNRLRLFLAICGLRNVAEEPESREGELPLLPLQVEFFRRYQLAVQMRFYKGRAGQHRKAARRHTVIILVAVFVAAGISAYFKLPNSGAWLMRRGIVTEDLLAFFGIALPVLFQAQESIMLMMGDRRNALRYDVTFENLQHIWQDLDKVRARAAAGDRDYFRHFAAQVHDQISTEHREWLRLTDPATRGLTAVIV